MREPENMADFGLAFMFEIQKDLVLSADVIDVMYTAIAKIATQKQLELQPVPEITDTTPEEEKEALQD